MEPERNEHPEIDADIRPEFGLNQSGDKPSKQAKGLNDAEKRAGSAQGNESTAGSSAADVRNQEETSNTGLYKPSGGYPEERGRTASVWQIAKKRGPLAAILTLGFGLPTIIAILFSPALVLQQFAETLTGKFNDQLGALDVRSTLLLKKKYNSTLTKGVCGTKITIRCKYQSIRENSGLAKRLNNAGIKINADKKSIIPGRVKPTSFEFNGKTIKAGDLLNEARKNPDLRKALRKGYDPLYAAFSDRNAADLRTRLGLKRSSNVKSSTDKDKMDDDLKKTASGENNIPADGEKLRAVEKDGKTTGYVDSNGTLYSVQEGQRLNNLIDEGIARANFAEKVTKTALKSSLKGALTTTALGAGVVDSACSAWTMIRVAGFAAKYYQQRQLIRYGYEFMKIAHKQKTGEATAEEVAFFGDKLTSTNSEGKNALNSDGYNFAAYGDIFKPGDFQTPKSQSNGDVDKAADEILIQNETSRYVNGQLLNDNVMSNIVKLVTGSSSSGVSKADSVCKFTKSWKGQALVFGLAAAGVVVAVLTGGFSVGAGAVAQGAASIAISVAFALIQPKLIDMAKGEVIKGDENGNETGNAAVSGIGGYNAQTAPASGLRPATQDSYSAYLKTANEVAAKYAKEDRESRSPFDPTSSNTFLGSILASVVPFTSKMQTASSASIAIPSLVSSSLASLGSGQKTYAADDADQYKQCNDHEYEGLAADPFCNLRYATGEIDADPEAVLDYMLEHNQIVSDEDPTPLPGSQYEDFVNKCLKRQSSIGDKYTSYKDGQSESDADGEGGLQCVYGRQSKEVEHRNNMFSAFWIDTRADDGMDNDFDVGTGATNLTGATFRVATFNVLHTPDSFGSCSWHCRLGRAVSTLKEKQIDVVGFQEMREAQQKDFKDPKAEGYGADIYDTYPSVITDGQGANENPESVVAWNKTKFQLVEGRQKPIKYEGNRKVNIVKLRYIENGANGPEFYVLNTHDPIDKRADSEGGPRDRKDNNELYYSTIKTELTDAPVIMTGDFNSKMTVAASGNKPLGGTRDNLAYCIMTRDSLLLNASDVQQGKGGDCPSEKDIEGFNRIDYIFISPNLTADNYGHAKDHQNGSDHDTVFSDITIPGAALNTGAGTTFVAGTYNQPVRGNSTAAANKIIENKMDIIGMQELGGDNYFNIKNILAQKGYKVYPSISRGENKSGHCSSARPIFYNASGQGGTRFRLVKSQIFDVPSYETTKASQQAPEYVNPQTCGNNGETTKGGGRANIPVVWLQDIDTEQTIIFINTHNLANCCGSAGVASKKRAQAAEIYVSQVQALKAANPGVPIFFSGDFNEGTGVRRSGNVTYQLDHNNLLYCKFKQSGAMSMVIGGKQQPCKTDHEGYQGVDYIYATPGVNVEWTKEFRDPSTDDAPHMVQYGRLVVPGSGASKSALPSKDGWVWPVPDVKSLGTLGYGERGSKGIHKGIDIGISGGAALGKTVVAAHSGTVSRVWGNGTACGTYISIKATGTNYYAAYQHVAGDSVTVKAGDPVQAGQPIAKIGRQGGSTCGSSGFFHLHFSVESKPGTVSEYADPFPNGTINPLTVLPR